MSFFGIPIRNGLSLGLGTVASLTNGPGFLPSELYYDGTVQGAWYDPSDLTTLFQNSAGTTPVTAVEQPVGLMLDKSQNGVGTNGAKRVNLLTFTEQFDNAAWTKDSCTITANATTAPNGTLTADKVVSAAATAQTGVSQSIGTNSGQFTQSWFVKQAEVRYVQLLWSGGASAEYANFDLQTGVVTQTTASVTPTISAAANGFYRITLTSTLASATVIAYCWSIGSGTAGRGGTYPGNGVDGFFVWGADLRLTSEASTLPLYQRIDANWYSTMAGNHAFQSTSASRPTLRARYNLLTRSEEFNDAAWTKSNTTATANGAVAPDGTTTADLIYPTTSGASRAVYQGVAGATVGASYTSSVYAKASGLRWICLSSVRGTSARAAWFDVLNGAVGTITGGVSASISSVGNGWYRCTVTDTTSVTTIFLGDLILADADNSTSVTASGTNGVLLWGAQLVPTAVFPSNTYQRIGAATDYATGAAFPPYLFFDGTDDSMLTNSVDFTGTDKMLVVAGVTKQSDAVQVINELSANSDQDVGSFYLANVSPSTLRHQVAGTPNAGARAYGETTLAILSTSVVTQQFNIAGTSVATEIAVRQNGVSQTLATPTGSAGTGNFGNYPLFIGRRNNTSFAFNGNIYSLVIAGAAYSAGQISSTESWVAAKTPLGTI